MPSDPSKPLLRLTPQTQRDRPVGKPKFPPRPEEFPQARQTGAFAPKFDRLAEVLNRDPTGLELRADPTALAPERLLVFEVRGSIADFASAVHRVPGLELVDEEELGDDSEDKAPVAYLMVPDIRALRNLEGLWQRWQRTGMSIQLNVQRDPDQGIAIDDPVPFGLAVTMSMPGVIEIYDQVRQRLAIPQRAPA